MQVVIDSSSETGKLCCIYMEKDIQSCNVNQTYTMAWTATLCGVSKYIQRMLLNFQHQHLASTSYMKITTKEDVIKEDDVTNTFVVERDDDDKTYI